MSKTALFALALAALAACSSDDGTIKEEACQIQSGAATPDSLGHIGCRADFLALASDPLDTSLPGAQSGKVVMDQLDNNALYFQNSKKYQIHYQFASTHLSGNGKPIVWSSLTDANGFPLVNPFGTKGTPLARSPKTQASMRARYDFDVGSYGAFAQIAGNYRSSSYTSTDRLGRNRDGSPSTVLNSGYAEFDASVGIAKDAWSIEAYCSNIADRRNVDYSDQGQSIRSDIVTRPRTLSLRVTYQFKDH